MILTIYLHEVELVFEATWGGKLDLPEGKYFIHWFVSPWQSSIATENQTSCRWWFQFPHSWDARYGAYVAAWKTGMSLRAFTRAGYSSRSQPVETKMGKRTKKCVFFILFQCWLHLQFSRLSPPWFFISHLSLCVSVALMGPIQSWHILT